MPPGGSFFREPGAERRSRRGAPRPSGIGRRSTGFSAVSKRRSTRTLSASRGDPKRQRTSSRMRRADSAGSCAGCTSRSSSGRGRSGSLPAKRSGCSSARVAAGRSPSLDPIRRPVRRPKNRDGRRRSICLHPRRRLAGEPGGAAAAQRPRDELEDVGGRARHFRSARRNPARVRPAMPSQVARRRASMTEDDGASAKR